MLVKLYVSYAIYGFLRHFKQLVDFSLTSDQIDVLKNEGSLVIDLNDYHQHLPDYMKNASAKYSQTLRDYFNAPDGFFDRAEIEFSFGSVGQGC